MKSKTVQFLLEATMRKLKRTSDQNFSTGCKETEQWSNLPRNKSGAGEWSGGRRVLYLSRGCWNKNVIIWKKSFDNLILVSKKYVVALLYSNIISNFFCSFSLNDIYQQDDQDNRNKNNLYWRYTSREFLYREFWINNIWLILKLFLFFQFVWHLSAT